MKGLLTAALLMLLTTSAIAADANQAPGKQEQAITSTAESFFDAWNQHDVGTMVTFWSDDATLINPMGRLAQGRAGIEALLSEEQTTVFKASTAKVVDLKVTRSLGPNMAFCDGEMTVDGAQGPDGSAMPQMKMHLALIMERKGDRWMIAEARPYAFGQAPSPPARTE